MRSSHRASEGVRYMPNVVWMIDRSPRRSLGGFSMMVKILLSIKEIISTNRHFGRDYFISGENQTKENRSP